MRDYCNDTWPLLTVTHQLLWFLYVSDKDRWWLCRLDSWGLCAFCFFLFCQLGCWKVNIHHFKARWRCPVLWLLLVSLCFAGAWHWQLSGARATCTSCRKRNRRSRRRRRGSGWGGRSSWEQSHDLPVSRLTQTAIQRGEKTTQINSVSFLSVSHSGLSAWIQGMCIIYVYCIRLFCLKPEPEVFTFTLLPLKAALINIYMYTVY